MINNIIRTVNTRRRNMITAVIKIGATIIKMTTIKIGSSIIT
jgi:hypothetical protein